MQNRIRELFDADRPLPDVALNAYNTENWTDLGLKRQEMDIVVADQIVGGCTLVTQTPPYGSKVHFDDIELDKNFRGKGQRIGLATYVAAIGVAHTQNLPFETQDHTQSEHAVKIWRILQDVGLAQEIEPFRPARRSSFPNQFKGKYIVPVRK